MTRGMKAMAVLVFLLSPVIATVMMCVILLLFGNPGALIIVGIILFGLLYWILYEGTEDDENEDDKKEGQGEHYIKAKGDTYTA